MAARLGRLKTRPEFLKVAASRRKWVTPGLILQARQRPANESGREGGAESEAIRVGFTVSRKVGNAVRRNRARRRLRAVAEQVLSQQGLAGNDYVIVGRYATPERAYSDLCGDLSQALTRLKSGAPDQRAARTDRRAGRQEERKDPQ